jgi:transposase
VVDIGVEYDCGGRSGAGAAAVAHLAEISTQVEPNAHAVLLVDGAGWHQRGDRLIVPENISLLPLPPYSPELNPMENVWEYLRANKLCSRVWESYDEIVNACRKAWDFLVDDPDRIRSIGSRDWLCVNL